MSIKRKIILMGIILAVLPVLAMLGTLSFQNIKLQKTVGADVSKQWHSQLAAIVKDVYAMCQGQQESLELSLKGNLNVARNMIENKGGIDQMIEIVNWTAKNQFTQEVVEVKLPKLALGDVWLGKVSSKNEHSPIVDDVVSLVGGASTIFQRMNARGDMLGVATSVINKEGKRAIGTFIPAIDADGKPNAVVSTVIKGGIYTGKAFVVDQWYIAAYEPLRDNKGEIIGMNFVGIPQQNITGLRKSIMSIKVGETGYVYVLGGSGDQKGKYIISKGGKRDGENIWESQDSNGQFFVQRLINTAVQLKGGEVAYDSYPWKNPGDSATTDRIAVLTYFEPWDWIIGGSAIKDEVLAIGKQINFSVSTLITQAVVTGIVLLILALILAVMIGGGISTPINRVAQSLKEIASGDANLAKRIKVNTNDEVGNLAQWFNTFVDKIEGIVLEIKKGSVFIDQSASQIQTVSQEQASGAAEQSAAVNQASSTVKELASTASYIATNAESVAKTAERTLAGMQEINSKVEMSAKKILALGEKTQSIGNITTLIDEIADQTNLLAHCLF